MVFIEENFDALNYGINSSLLSINTVLLPSQCKSAIKLGDPSSLRSK